MVQVLEVSKGAVVEGQPGHGQAWQASCDPPDTHAHPSLQACMSACKTRAAEVCNKDAMGSWASRLHCGRSSDDVPYALINQQKAAASMNPRDGSRSHLVLM